jgi:hypothetical protein
MTDATTPRVSATMQTPRERAEAKADELTQTLLARLNWKWEDVLPTKETVALALLDFRREALEEAAKLCDEPVHHQHPMKPAGVVMSTTPASPAHAAAIRALKEPS